MQGCLNYYQKSGLNKTIDKRVTALLSMLSGELLARFRQCELH